MTNSEQMAQQRDSKGRITGGKPPNGLDKNPQNRHNGAWKKEDTPRFKLEMMMKMNDEELLAVYADKQAPLFERKLAQAINKGDWRTIREITHEVYGTPKQSVDMTTNGQSLAPPIIRIIDERTASSSK